MTINYISIKKLHGFKDVFVDFNSDLTLLVGKNGSGKTTVLNILSSILTGQLAPLLKYEFEIVYIEYYEGELYRTISLENFNGSYIISGETGTHEVEKLDLRNQHLHSKTSSAFLLGRKNESSDLTNFEPIKSLKKACPTYFLSLTRDIHKNQTEYSTSSRPVSNLDESIKHVNELATIKYHEIISKSERYNREMRNEIFQAMFSYDTQNYISPKKVRGFPKDDEIKKLSNALREIGLDSEAFERFVNLMNKDMKSVLDNPDDQFNEKERKIQARLVANMSQYFKIKSLSEIAEKKNQKKIDANKPITTFLETVNSFLVDSGKSIFLRTEDKLGLFFKLLDPQSKDKYFELSKLSSGEKQLVIFFAYLIFQKDNNDGSTFIIDEPELSLHLHWQQRFCKAALSIAPNNQFIFATHSPEIIGPFREKCKPLGKEI
ncbi:AAA family ATPase [Paenibacillus physcomitrellae]|uniref:Endonuclease GajA/Old nuclease/RecF-like AAA domain-containing protein n=1 Tax=Paenibacillus physcomitrellae TaxID=1619311 RepID=A0ABQ1FQN2_9BACL|nr:AAA family ATPase [Paenibacillus physcomitrellae]GGA24131.1 hypothetical protein GCM10010917_06180 [Paenibacillus physcomitrellae]